MKNVILVIGNEILSEESITLQIVRIIRKKYPQFSFVSWDPTEELPKEAGKHVHLIDTIYGIKHIRVYQTINDFFLSPRNTVHDFDLPVAIQLLQKLGKITDVKIIGVPVRGNIRMLTKQVSSWLDSISL